MGYMLIIKSFWEATKTDTGLAELFISGKIRDQLRWQQQAFRSSGGKKMRLKGVNKQF